MPAPILSSKARLARLDAELSQSVSALVGEDYRIELIWRQLLAPADCRFSSQTRSRGARGAARSIAREKGPASALGKTLPGRGRGFARSGVG